MPRGRKKSTEPKEEKSFSVCEEGNAIIKSLCEKYPKILWACDPSSIQVYGVDNAERPASSDVMAKIRVVNGVLKAVLENNKINLTHIIEMYWSDWHEWPVNTRQFIIFHELLHVIDPESKKLRRHNIEDFDLILDVIGINGYGEGVPNLLGDEPVEFKSELIAKLQKPDGESVDEDNTPTPPEE